jgi:hypothetical protein
MSHTPGPWEITTRPTFGWDVKVKDRDWLICGVCFEDDDDKKADALLIAAAPELMEALECMVEMVEMKGFGKAYAMDISRAAIAKARGQG